MGDELSVTPGELVSLHGEHSLSDIIRPLTREIYLFDSYVAGTTHLKDKIRRFPVTMIQRFFQFTGKSFNLYDLAIFSINQFQDFF